ncbi:hypothetical protein BFS08_05250 [Gardnerella sp. KA00735]|nr:hypothetical protein BFS08_05250 [Gardnerella sp. KA00735]
MTKHGAIGKIFIKLVKYQGKLHSVTIERTQHKFTIQVVKGTIRQKESVTRRIITHVTLTQELFLDYICFNLALLLSD